MLTGNDFIGALILLGAFALVIAAAETWCRVGRPRPEAPRKLIHIGGGLVCLLYPFLIENHDVVLAMALGFVLLFTIARRLDFLRSLHAVERRTRGSEFYPFAIWLIFIVSREDLWLYVATVLVLTLADGLAGLVGTRFGRHRYRISTETVKSIEGSLVFWGVSFAAICLSLVLLRDMPLASALLVALIASFLLTCLEAVSIYGTDNILVPVLACYVLLKLTLKPLPELIFQSVSLFAIVFLFGWLCYLTRVISIGSALILVGVAYAGWSLGSWHWEVPLILGFLVYVAFRWWFRPVEARPGVVPKTILAILIIPLALIILANAMMQHSFFFAPYVAVCAATAVLTSWDVYFRAKSCAPTARRGASLAIVLIIPLLVIVPTWLVVPGRQLLSVLTVSAVSILSCAYYCLAYVDAELAQGPRWSSCQFLATLGAATFCFLLQYLGLLEIWQVPL